jgi:GAF domain-containing protein
MNEVKRLKALEFYKILDTLPEQCYDDLTVLASVICSCPIALISFVDKDRQWFKSRIGFPLTETTREVSFCSHAIKSPNHLMVIPDAREDERFKSNSLVLAQNGIRFYAGAPMLTPAGLPLGTICVIDSNPREISEEQSKALMALSRQVVHLLELGKGLEMLKQSIRQNLKCLDQLENLNRL